MLRRIVILISIGLIAGASAEKSDKLDQIQKSLDKIVSKAGISFDGEFKSEYLPSTIGGTGSNQNGRTTESNEFTSVDFDVKARPTDMVMARVIFRLHQNWENFFSDVANPIFTRWISIDGNVKDMVGFHVGDFKEKYSPLTLYTPQIDILNEPYIFARQREIAQDEMFIGDNSRFLQGLNLKVDAEIVPLFNEFHLGIIGSRLRNIETSIKNGSKVTPAMDTASLSKYLLGGNLDLTMLKGVNLGGTYLFIFDQKHSYRGSDTTADTLAQRTSVISARPGVDITKMIGVEALKLNIATEFAFSIDDSTRFGKTATDSVKKFYSTSINGSAMNLGAEIGISPSSFWSIGINASYINNSNDFRNELAQSPSFIGDRIFNNENNATAFNMYNTFDALDHSVFKFCPSDQLTNRWAKAPFMKTSYGHSIYTQDELARIKAAYMDTSVQLIMPFGPATPNRAGINADLKADFVNNGIEAKVLVASLKERDDYSDTSMFRILKAKASMKADSTMFLPKANYSQFGGGLKLDFSKIIPAAFKYPLELSGSYVLSSASRPALDSTLLKFDVKSAFINAGLYYKFYKRAALMVGLQLINNDYTFGDSTRSVSMTNWAVGLEWKVSQGADVNVSYGQMLRDNPETSNDMYQNLVDVSLRVKF